jgi:hypothetical protein
MPENANRINKSLGIDGIFHIVGAKRLVCLDVSVDQDHTDGGSVTGGAVACALLPTLTLPLEESGAVYDVSKPKPTISANKINAPRVVKIFL